MDKKIGNLEKEEVRMIKIHNLKKKSFLNLKLVNF